MTRCKRWTNDATLKRHGQTTMANGRTFTIAHGAFHLRRLSTPGRRKVMAGTAIWMRSGRASLKAFAHQVVQQRLPIPPFHGRATLGASA